MSSTALLLISTVLPAKCQEAKERDREHKEKSYDPKDVSKAIDRLKQAVNGHANVKNHCRVREHDLEVQENSEITDAEGCGIVVTTKKSSSGNGDTRFTLRADLMNLTTPSSVEPLTLRDCKPEEGSLIQVVSRVKPGKTIPTSKASSSAEQSVHEQPTVPRKSLSLFFPNAESARKAARALDRAVAVCGGEEWPDEDDLP